MQVVVRQISGLGNQLFQYAAGRYYAERHRAAMRLITNPERTAASYGYPRPFLLSQLRITAPVSELSFTDRLILSERPLLKVARPLLRTQVFTESVAQRYRFLPELPLRPRLRALYLVGYWQTYRMVRQIEEQLRAELAFKLPAQAETLRTLQQIRRTHYPVSLHVRRGDYTLAAEGHIALPMSYYSQAIAHFTAKLPHPTFFVFSDDIAFVKQTLPRAIDAVFVEHNDSMSSHDDLRLMAACRHHIIANSTFSWWGAWLNPSPEKTVVAPKHWLLREDSFYPDLLPPEWTLLDTAR